MEKKTVKLGIVGLFRGRNVVDRTMKNRNFELRAICDKNPERLETARKLFEEEHKVENLLCFESFEELLKSDVDAVYIATDAPLHTPQVIQALEAGKHVLSEIPTINSMEDARALKAAVKAHPNQKYMVGENCCYWEFIQHWKEIYESGKLGQIVYAEAEYLHAENINKFKNAEKQDLGWRKNFDAIKYLTHDLGPLLYIMNDRCVSVTCMQSDIVYNPNKEGKQTGVALFKTEKGALIRILICFGAFTSYDHNYCMFGTHGTLQTDKNKNIEHAHTFASFSDIPGSFAKKVELPWLMSSNAAENAAGHGGADPKMLRAFIQCIIDDTEPPIDVDAGIAMSIPGIIACESAKQGGALMEIPVIE